MFLFLPLFPFLTMALPLIVPFLSACGDFTASPAHSEGSLVPSVSDVSGNPDEWTRMSGTYTVRVREYREASSDAADNDTAQAGVQYEHTTHVERVQHADSSWHTTLTWDPPSTPLTLAPSTSQASSATGRAAYSVRQPPVRPPVTRAQFDDRGNFQLYDATGAPVPLPDSLALAKYVQQLASKTDSAMSTTSRLTRSPGAKSPMHAVVRGAPFRGGGRGSNSTGLTPGRAFDIGEILVAPVPVATVQSRALQRNLALSTRPNGNLAYQESRRDTVVETVVSRTTGLPIELRASVGGVVRMRASASYLKLTDSLYVRAHVVTEQRAPQSGTTVVLESAWSDLEFGGAR